MQTNEIVQCEMIKLCFLFILCSMPNILDIEWEKQAHIPLELDGTCQFYHKCFQD